MHHRLFQIVVALALTGFTRTTSPLAQAPLRAVIVVRHAEKAAAPKDNPPLSPAGTARAQALLDALRDAGITTIITTDQVRTRETAAPLLAALHLEGVVVPRTEDPKADAAALRDAVRKAGGTVLVVSHQLTIPHIIEDLGGPTVPTVCDVEFSNLWVLVPEGAAGKLGLIRSSFGAADPPVGPDCRITPVSPP